jgi:hypothetical protein
MISKEKCVLCNNLNSKELINEKELCEECLDDIYKCEQCGIAQPYCSDCV